MQFDWLNFNKEAERAFEKKLTEYKLKITKLGELNKSLEERVKAREQDVKKAEKNILTIIQTWRKIKSSESLSNILSIIVSGINLEKTFLIFNFFS